MFNEKTNFSSFEKKPNKNKLKKSLFLDRLILSGLLLLQPNIAYSIENYNQEEKKIKTSVDNKLEMTNPKPESYDIEKINALDLRYITEKKTCNKEAAIKIISSAILFDHYNSQGRMAVYINKIDEYNKVHPEFSNMSLEEQKSSSDEFNALYEEYVDELNKFKGLYDEIMSSSVEKAKERLDAENVPDSLKVFADKGQDIIKIVESERTSVLNHINSEEYLEMLKIEFNCSIEEAKAHQKTRFKNVNNANYYFKDSQGLSNEYGAAGLFLPNTNVILIPYDIDFMNEDSDKIQMGFFKEIVAHEFWHIATNAESGMSLTSKALLEISRDELQDNNLSYNIEYLGNPTERYVRFKSLEFELGKMKIWSKDKIFSRECSDKMLDAYINKKFINEDSYQFIESIILSKNDTGHDDILNYERLYVVFSKIFNSIASLETNKTYYPAEWWGTKEEKA